MGEKSRTDINEFLRAISIPIETTTKKSLAQVKDEQKEILEKINKMIEEFKEISKTLPKSDLKESVDRINSICDRLESCRKRIQKVTVKANRLITELEPKIAAKYRTGTIIDTDPPTK